MASDQQQQMQPGQGASSALVSTSPSPTPSTQQQQHQEQLWEWFVVVGLPNSGLQTVQGDTGFLGTEQKYKAGFVDSLPHSTFDEACRLPPQLPTCCLPAGIDIVLCQDLECADLTPHTFACVLTEGDGTKVYASCLTFYDRVPPDLCAKHEDLLGAVALKALCLLSRRPYLASSQQVLRELYASAFHHGTLIPLGDLINSLLAVPCPQQDGPKLCLRLCASQRVVCPPLPIGPPPGEVSLQPLLEVMQPDSLVGLFAAVLLEQRVLIRCRHHWLLTVAAEGVVRLLYPLKYQHVYIPVMPCSLTDYLEAPTPFLMGLHSSEPLEQRVLDSLVVADLDRGTLHLGKDDGLMKRCLSHPYMRTLERRVRMLMQPSVTDADVVTTSSSSSSGSSHTPQDPWLAAAKALGPGAPWSPSKQALLVRMFMQFFQEVLKDYQLFLSSNSSNEGGGLTAGAAAGAAGGGSSGGGGALFGERSASSFGRRDSRLTSGGGSSGGAAMVGRALRGALSGISGGVAGGVGGASGSSLAAVGRSSSLAAGAGGLLQAQSLIGMQALLDHHFAICRHKDPALLQQVMQGLPFLCFVGEHSSLQAQQQDPTAWLRGGEASLGAWRAAEEEVSGGGLLGCPNAGSWVQQPGSMCSSSSSNSSVLWGKAAARPGMPLGLQEDGFAGTVVCIPDQPPSGLMPPRGLLHSSFPLLVLSEYSERSLQQGGLLRRRKTAVSRQKRPSVGRRRAISELMGSPLDLRRKTPLPGTNTDTSPPRLLRGNGLETIMPSGGMLPGGSGSSVQQPPLTPLAPGLPLPSLSKISNVSNSSTNASLSEEYSAEADLIGRQIGMLVLLMQAASTAAAVSAAAAACTAPEQDKDNSTCTAGAGAEGPGSSSNGAAAETAAGSRAGSSNGSSNSQARREDGVSFAPQPRRAGSLGGVSAAAVLRRCSSSGIRSSSNGRAQLSPDVLEAARQLLCIQTGGNGWFIVSRLKELVANPPAPFSKTDASSGASAAAANSKASAGGAAAAGAASAAGMAANAAAGKKGVADGAAGGSSSKGSPPKGTMLAKSGKLLGVNLSGGSSSSSKASGLAGLKVSHGVESFASAASAMASVISRNTSTTKQKQQHAAASGGSATSSPTNTVDTSKVSNSAPSSTCGAGSGLGAVAVGAAGAAPAFHHSMSCKVPDHREHRMAVAVTGSEGGASPAAAAAADALNSTDSCVVIMSTDGAGNNSNTASSSDAAGPSNIAADAEAPSADAACSTTNTTIGGSCSSCGSDGAAKPAAAQQQGSAGNSQQHQQLAGGGGPVERPVPADIFDVLADMLNAIIEVAAGQDDSRVVLTVLELASVITCHTSGGAKRYLLSRLAGNPVMHTECFWAATFAFAVSSSYLNDAEFASVRGVVTKCLQQFAGYLAGIGVPGTAAYVLLVQIGSEHLALAHAGPLEPTTQLEIRRRIAQAQQQAGLVLAPSPPPGVPAAAASDAISSSSNTSSSSKQGSKQQQPSTGATPDIAASLRVCGIDLPGFGGGEEQQRQQQSSATAAPEPDPWSWCSSNDSDNVLPGDQAGATGISCCKAAVMIPAPGGPDRPSTGSECAAGTPTAAGGARTSVSSGVIGSAASDTEAPIVAALRPMGSLQQQQLNSNHNNTPASPRANTNNAASAAAPVGQRWGGGSLASAASTSTISSCSPRVGSLSAPLRAAKEGYGSYAKLLNRQALAGAGSSPTAALASAASMASGPDGLSSPRLGAAYGAGDADEGAGAASSSPAAPALSVHGGCLVDQGALQWAAVHSKGVVALAASSYTAVSVGLDGYMKVLDLSGGKMRLAASMQIPSLVAAASTASTASDAVHPVLQLWHDGQRAAVGNARHQAVWIVDLVGGSTSLELSGLGSAVSCLFPLYRNRDALLSGLTHGSVVCGHAATGSGGGSDTAVAAAYLWDLRRPKKPASSLNFVPDPPSASSPHASSVLGDAASAVAGAEGGVPGILCLSVHEDGALAAAGFRDGKVLTWDMRQPGVPLSECQGHTGPVKQISFLPAAASAAAGLGRLPLLLTGSEDWTARLWEAQSGTCRGVCIGHGGAVTAMQTVHSNTATRFVTGAADGSIGVWGLDGEMCSLVQQHEQPVMLLRQGGDTLVSGAADKSCNVWGVQGLLSSGSGSGSSNGSSSSSGMIQASRLLASERKPAAVSAMTFDPVAEVLCAGHRDGVVSVWNCCYSTQCSTIFE